MILKALLIWTAASFLIGPVIGKWLQHRVHTVEKRQRLQYWRDSEAYRRLREGTPPSGRTPPPA